jgi:hypothetical protein
MEQFLKIFAEAMVTLVTCIEARLNICRRSKVNLGGDYYGTPGINNIDTYYSK